jgi:hypothetical protein
MNKLSDIELGWLAGLLEGEGCFRISQGRYPKVQLNMTDEDIVLRAASLITKLTGVVPTISVAQPAKIDWSESYSFQVSGKNAKIVMKTIVHIMGFRRRQKIWQILNGYNEPKSVLNKADIVKLVLTNKGRVA